MNRNFAALKHPELLRLIRVKLTAIIQTWKIHEIVARKYPQNLLRNCETNTFLAQFTAVASLSVVSYYWEMGVSLKGRERPPPFY